MKILVTGGAGFIASHVVDAYIDGGHEVIVIDNLSTGRKENLHGKAKFYECDICSPEVRKIIGNEKLDLINHHAAQIDVRKSTADPLFDIDVNVKGFVGLLEAAKDCDVKKVILASTGGAIYGEQDYYPADENHPTNPISPYGINKLVSEKYLHYYKNQYGIDYAVLRYANVYGSRQNAHGEAGVVAIFASRMLDGGQPIINGDGRQTRDYVYVGDVVKVNLLVLNEEASGIYNVGTGVETDVNAVFRALRELTGSNCEEKHIPTKPGEQARSVIGSARLESEFDWKPETSLADGMNNTVEWFKNKKSFH